LSYEEIGSAAMLSRAIGGLIGTTALFALPGSTGACRTAMSRLILPELPHLVSLAKHRARGSSHDE
jgi:molybdenum cofactor biosynthesis protein B